MDGVEKDGIESNCRAKHAHTPSEAVAAMQS